MEMPDASEVIPYLWITNHKAAFNEKFIKDNDIAYIINVTTELPNMFSASKHIEYLRIPLERNKCYLNLTNHFIDSSQFIYDAIKKNRSILVHSNDDERAAVIIAGFLIRFIGLDYIESVAYMNSVRNKVMGKNTCLLNQVFKFYEFCSSS